MKTRILLLFAFAVCSSVSGVFAQEPDAIYKAVEPFVKENTYLVVHVDLEKLELDAFFEKAQKRTETFMDKVAAKMPDAQADAERMKNEQLEQLAATKTMAGALLPGLQAAGVKEFYLLGTIELLQQYPFVVAVPGASELNPQVDMALTTLQLPLQRAGFKDGMTFFVTPPLNSEATDPSKLPDPKGLFKFMDTLKTADRPEIQESFALHARSPVKVVLALSETIKLFLQMTAPAMLSQLPGTSPEDQTKLLSFIQKTKSVSVGINPASMRINGALQVVDEETAKSFAEQLKMFMEDSLKNVPDEMPQEMKEKMLKQAEATKPFMEDILPKPMKDRLIVVINEKLLDKHEDLLAELQAEAIMTAIRFGRQFQQNQ